MARIDPTITAPNKSRKSTERNDAIKTTASLRSLRWGLISSQLIILAPKRMMTAAIAGIGIMAMTRAKKSTNSNSHNAEATIARRLWIPSLCTNHIRLKEAQVGSEDKNGRRQLETA